LNLSKLLQQIPHNIQNFGKNRNFKIVTTMKISDGIVYVSSLQFFLGGQGNSSGNRRNIAESFAKTLGKIFGQFCELKFYQNRNTTSATP